jgi:hypothetical protein
MEGRDTARGHEQTVFILNVEHVELVQLVLPVRIWLARLNCRSDLFSGQLYKSARKNAFAAVVAEAVEGELEFIPPVGVSAEDSEVGEIQRRAKVVDGIADYQAKRFWDGFVGLDCYGGLAFVWIKAENEPHRALREVGLNLPVQVIDVMHRA